MIPYEKRTDDLPTESNRNGNLRKRRGAWHAKGIVLTPMLLLTVILSLGSCATLGPVRTVSEPCTLDYMPDPPIIQTIPCDDDMVCLTLESARQIGLYLRETGRLLRQLDACEVEWEPR